MQGAQSSGSRTRGIGRYTRALVRSMIVGRPEHEFILVLNGSFSESVEEIKLGFADITGPENFAVWFPAADCNWLNLKSSWKRNSSEIIREAFMLALEPDVILSTSIFEGSGDNAIVSVGKISSDVIQVGILYDLIPMLHPSIYLSNPDVKTWYNEKVEFAKTCDLLLAISNATKLDGVKHLGHNSESIANILGAHDDQFVPLNVTQDERLQVMMKFGLTGKFIMYTGGIDHRKNIDGLIIAYSKLPFEYRSKYQLCIVCSVNDGARQMLINIAEQHGLIEKDLIITGFVSEDDLVKLYNLCDLYVFPSWYEGFGLPLLEAMACGAPVLTGNVSSLPEVVGREDLLFDPHDPVSISEKIRWVLSSPSRIKELRQYSIERAATFTWKRSAEIAISSIEDAVEKRKTIKRGKDKRFRGKSRRRSLAYFSPMPPAKSGIADYSSMLLQELSKYYNVTVVVADVYIYEDIGISSYNIISADQFLDLSSNFDRIIYQFGNSDFHTYMFDLFEHHPGVSVLHDFNLGGIRSHLEMSGERKEAWSLALYNSHGYAPLVKRFKQEEVSKTSKIYPVNKDILNKSVGTIFHSKFANDSISKWYFGVENLSSSVVPMVRKPLAGLDKQGARRTLKVGAGSHVTCSFGAVAPTKLNHLIYEAWIQSNLVELPDSLLVFVGSEGNDSYAKGFASSVREGQFKDRVIFTGYVDSSTYDDWLQAADLTVQLRTNSNGESSGAIYDCLGAATPTICNTYGANSEVPEGLATLLPPIFTIEELANAMDETVAEADRVALMASNARQFVLEECSPVQVARHYFESIEKFYSSKNSGVHSVINSIKRLGFDGVLDNDFFEVVDAISKSLHPPLRSKQVLFDVSNVWECADEYSSNTIAILTSKLSSFQPCQRLEPVYFDDNGTMYYARSLSLALLGLPVSTLKDEPVDLVDGDIFLINERSSREQISSAIEASGFNLELQDLDTIEDVVT